MPFLTPADLEPFAPLGEPYAQALIEDAEALAVAAAPCLGESDNLTDAQRATVRAVLRGAIIRYAQSGSGAVTTQSAGPFSVSTDTRQGSRSMLWPSEIDQLRDICADTAGGGAFFIDTAGRCGAHRPWCDVVFGASDCSCGSVLAGYPLFEEGY